MISLNLIIGWIANAANIAKKTKLARTLKAIILNVDIIDTFGYVKIIFGDTYEEVNEGLQKCEEAYNKDDNKKLAAPYFELHRRKAYQRLCELQPSDIPKLT